MRTPASRCSAATPVGLLLIALAGGCVGKTDPSASATATPVVTPQHAESAPAERRGDGYYLSTCALCDRMLGTVGPAVDDRLGPRGLRFCTQACRDRFMADPAPGVAHVDSVMIADQSPHYPLATSVVSGRPLPGEDHAGVQLVWCNRLVRVADEHERRVFMQDPEKFVRALDEEVIRAQTPTYGMPNRCPVQGDILSNDEPIDFVVANRMVRVCCARCVRSVKARPYQYLAMVDYANREAASKRDDGRE